MLETTDPDTPLPPDQTDEHIPDGMEESPQLEGPLTDTGEQPPPQPEAQTLAEKHQTRRNAFERLSMLTRDASGDPPAAAEVPVEPQGDAPVETLNISSVLVYVKEFPGRARLRISAWWGKVARRARLAPAGETLPEGQEPPPPAPRPGRFKAGARRVWTAVRPVLWRGRIGPAFWTVASLLSLTVNIILIVLLILLGRQLFFLKKAVVSDQLITGLYKNFLLMDQAHIQTTIAVSDTIQVNDTIPVVFDLPLSANTSVVLTRDTPASTTIFLNNTAVPLDLILRTGTQLNIKLDMTVPVNQTIPISLNVPVNLVVPVDIPLDQTQLHKPFVGLQQVVSPFRQLLSEVPDTWGEACTGAFKFVCDLLKFK